MAFILPRPRYVVKERFLKRFRNCVQARVRIRYLIIVNNWNGRSAREIAKVLKIHNTSRIGHRTQRSRTSGIAHAVLFVAQCWPAGVGGQR